MSLRFGEYRVESFLRPRLFSFFLGVVDKLTRQRWIHPVHSTPSRSKRSSFIGQSLSLDTGRKKVFPEFRALNWMAYKRERKERRRAQFFLANECQPRLCFYFLVWQTGFVPASVQEQSELSAVVTLYRTRCCFIYGTVLKINTESIV